VRAWTALERRLREPVGEPEVRHLPEEWLLKFETHSVALEPETRRRIDVHLAECVSCRDELAALRAFDSSKLAGAVAPGRRWRLVLAETLGNVRTVVLHPAFAYGVVVIALLPTARHRQRREPPRSGAAERLHAVGRQHRAGREGNDRDHLRRHAALRRRHLRVPLPLRGWGRAT
jgi:hypothetical protein